MYLGKHFYLTSLTMKFVLLVIEKSNNIKGILIKKNGTKSYIERSRDICI